MNFHFISVLNPRDFFNSRIPSYRLRLSYVFNAAKELDFKISGDLSVPKETDIFYVGKLDKTIDKKIIKKITNDLKNTNAKIYIDYTDDWLHSNEGPNKLIYENLFLLDSTAIVPVEGLGKKLKKLGKNVLVIPDGIDDIQNILPFSKNNEKRNVLWHGHSSNANSLIRVLSNRRLTHFPYSLLLCSLHLS